MPGRTRITKIPNRRIARGSIRKKAASLAAYNVSRVEYAAKLGESGTKLIYELVPELYSQAVLANTVLFLTTDKYLVLATVECNRMMVSHALVMAGQRNTDCTCPPASLPNRQCLVA